MSEASPANQRHPTIYDVAREANVSIATVSNAMNKPARVGAATRKRVLEIANQMGFVPKSEAATRARRQVGRVAVIAPFSSYPSYLRRLVGVMQTLSGTDLELVLYDQESAAISASPVLASLPVRGHLDGVIVMGQPIDDMIELRLHERGLPVVVVDAESPRYSAVTVDDVQGGREAARHLLELGHRSLGYIQESQFAEYVSQAQLRFDGAAEEFRAAGGEVIVVSCEGNQAAGGRAARQLLTRPSPPTAVMAHYDDLALGALRAARDLGFRVAEDVSIMGYDDGPAADAADLTTIRQPFEETGIAAVRLLLAAIAQPTPRSITRLQTSVTVRSTTGPAPVR
ncbi:LacI family DNA-binding transcriptional regulator [Microbacterium pumilum]|uniref:LacI family DNA-binding transcriptional regulator n=1 Tax=Microbacterium pumilum TaxID=344165 RepID=A0ABP5EF66_9MICO